MIMNESEFAEFSDLLCCFSFLLIHCLDFLNLFSSLIFVCVRPDSSDSHHEFVLYNLASSWLLPIHFWPSCRTTRIFSNSAWPKFCRLFFDQSVQYYIYVDFFLNLALPTGIRPVDAKAKTPVRANELEPVYDELTAGIDALLRSFLSQGLFHC